MYLNFIPIADITYMENNLFKNIYQKAIKINAITYCPPNFLRMAMYQDLSRPMGDVSRCEKVLKRIILLNKHFPLIGQSCKNLDFHADQLVLTLRRPYPPFGLLYYDI